MNFNDCMNYWTPACLNLDLHANNINELFGLDHLLGLDEFQRYVDRPAYKDYPIDEELKRLLIMLAGPHGKTILKAYRIKKGLEGK